MGASESREEDGPGLLDEELYEESPDGLPERGLRVLAVERSSPAAMAVTLGWEDGKEDSGTGGLTSFFDVILSANGEDVVSPQGATACQILAHHLPHLPPPPHPH